MTALMLAGRALGSVLIKRGDTVPRRHQRRGAVFLDVLKLPRDFWSGVALASPFLADLVSWKIAGFLMVPWMLHAALVRPAIRGREVTLFLGTAILVVVTHIAALAHADTPYVDKVIKETILAVAMLCVAFSSDRNCRAATGFYLVVCSYGTLTAIIGLLKLGLQDRGYLLQFVIEQCPQQYPQGASLCGDYNLTGMMWLVAATGLVSAYIKSRNLLWIALVPVVLAAGALAGSRRFLLLVGLLPVIWLIVDVSRDQALRSIGRSVATVILVSAAAIALVQMVGAPEQFERFRFGVEKYTTLAVSDLWSDGPPREAPPIRPPNRAYPDVIAGTIGGQEGGEPAASRVDRWALASEMIRGHPLFGVGFSYHQVYSCRFVGCKFVDYPHMAIASEWLIAGVSGLALASLFYLSLAMGVLRRGIGGLASGVSTAVIFVVPYSLISGDTLFSIPHLLAVGVLLQLTPTRGATT